MKSSAIFIIALALILRTYFVSSDKPCAARPIDGESVVCVCNVTYCDELTRESPKAGGYVAYTSSKSGLRFEKTYGVFESSTSNSYSDSCCLDSCSSTTLIINPNVKHQTIEGFGGSVTDSASINWKNLTSQVLQDYLIRSYFSDKGLEYNMIRVPIGGTDFSTHAYAYNELPINDFNLSNFSLPIEDTMFKLPMIHAIIEASKTDVHLLVTCWSPPEWMKANDELSGVSELREDCFQTYADYHMKFIEAYAANNVSIWGMTTTNEVVSNILPPIVKFNSLAFPFDDMGKWIVNNLGPTVRNSQFKDLKILTMDDQRYSIALWFETMVKHFPKVLDYIDGVAVHFYLDFWPMFTPALLSNIPKKYPGKFVLATEACEGAKPEQTKKVLLGSWDRANTYIKDILEDLNSDVVGWIDWNLCLNEQGGPNWVKNFVDSPIIVFPQNNEFVKQPMFYAMGHVSKFITRGSVRIDVIEKKGLKNESSIKNVAVETTRGTIVVVLWNDGNESTVAIKLGNKQAKVKLVAKSITTLEFLQEADNEERNCI